MAPRRNALPTVDFESTGNRARNAAGGNPGVSGFNNRTTTDLAAGFGALTDMVQRIQLERDTVKAVGEESRITTETAAAQAKLNPLDPDYQKQVADLWSGAKKQVMESGISSPAVLDDISKRMDRHGASMQIAAIGEVKTATSKKAELTYKDAVDATNAKIRNDPANANLYTDELKADTERLKIGMDPIAFEVVSRKAADELAKNQIIGYAEKGNFGAARNALKAQAPHLDTGAVSGLSSFIDGKESKARADGERAQTANLANYLVNVNDKAHGNLPWQGNEREVLDDMKKRRAISLAGYLTAVSTLNSAQDKYKVELQKNNEAITNAQNGTIKDQDQFDRYQKIVTGGLPIGALATKASQQDWDSVANFVKTQAAQHGFVGSETKNMLENADSMTDKSKASFVGRVASLAEDLEQTGQRPQGVSFSDTGTLAAVRAEAKRLREEGVPKDEAFAQAAQTTLGKGPITIQAEKDAVASAKTTLNAKEFDLPGKVKGVFASDGWFTANPVMGASLEATYRRLYEDAAKRTDDPAQREAITKAAMQRQYGPTSVGGRKEIVQYPVERELSRVTGAQFLTDDQKTAIVQREVLSILKDKGLQPMTVADRPDQPPFRLTPTDATAEAIRSGRPAGAYKIELQRGDGYFDTGLRYRVPNATELQNDETYKIYSNERAMKQAKERQQYLDSEPQNRERERNRRAIERSR